jgi:hypothetical protein
VGLITMTTTGMHDTIHEHLLDKAAVAAVLLLAPVAWLGALSAAYGLHHLACRQGWATQRLLGVTNADWIVIGSFGAALVACAVSWVAARHLGRTASGGTGNGLDLSLIGRVNVYVFAATNVFSIVTFVLIEPCI